ncbi:MAG: M28 family peptidase [Bacteroidales bacterium]
MNLFLGISLCGALLACSGTKSENKGKEPVQTKVQEVSVPSFDADSAYSYVARQLDFGYRIPNTESHLQAAEWLASELKRHGATVIVQDAPVTAFDNTILQAKNIIGQFNPEKKERILLFAHWDSRPFADHDPQKSNRKKPVTGANDGASGVGVLLEIARLIGKQAPDKGIDIIFMDAEDYGTPEFWQGEHKSESWALGTQYWARRPHKPGYRARYGILLDMVGAKDAVFPREGFSNYFAPSVVDKIWKAGRNLGYGNYFVEQEGGTINDDHYYVNTMMRIPSVDIIHLDPNSETGFFPYWHTTGDTLDKISTETLKAVGETVTYVIYNE